MPRLPTPLRGARALPAILMVLAVCVLIAAGLGAWGYRAVRDQLTLRRLAQEYASLSALDRTDPANTRMREDVSAEKARLLRAMAAASNTESARWARARARLAEDIDPAYRAFAAAYNTVHHRDGAAGPYDVASLADIDERLQAISALRDTSQIVEQASRDTATKLKAFMQQEDCDLNQWQPQFDAIVSATSSGEPYATIHASARAVAEYLRFEKSHSDAITGFDQGHALFSDPAILDEQGKLLDNITSARDRH